MQWVVIGGSYPGALAAWFKNLYPDLAVAAWASSAVVNAIENFTAFDQDIMVKTNSSQDGCTEAIRKINKDIYATLQFGNASQKQYLYDAFSNSNPDMYPDDFMFMVADTWAMGVQSGSRIAMCNYITLDYFLNDTIKNTG